MKGGGAGPDAGGATRRPSSARARHEGRWGRPGCRRRHEATEFGQGAPVGRAGRAHRSDPPVRPESLARSVPPSLAGRADPARTPPPRRCAPHRRTRDFLHRLTRPADQVRRPGVPVGGPGRARQSRGPHSGAGGRNRTADTRIFSPLLYRLSYPGGNRVGRVSFAQDRQPVDRTPRMGIRPRRDGEPRRPGAGGPLSPPDGGPDRWRDPFRRLSREGGPSPHPSPAALRAASVPGGLSPPPATRLRRPFRPSGRGPSPCGRASPPRPAAAPPRAAGAAFAPGPGRAGRRRRRTRPRSSR